MSFSNPTVIIGDISIDLEKFLFPKQLDKGPTYTISEVAKIFFARSTSWIRARESKATFDGVPLVEFLGRLKGERREYTLYDIERVAHSFCQCDYITGERLHLAIKAVQVQGVLWRFLLEG